MSQVFKERLFFLMKMQIPEAFMVAMSPSALPLLTTVSNFSASVVAIG